MIGSIASGRSFLAKVREEPEEQNIDSGSNFNKNPIEHYLDFNKNFNKDKIFGYNNNNIINNLNRATSFPARSKKSFFNFVKKKIF